MVVVIRDALRGLADLLFPLRCAGCGRPRTGWCSECGWQLGGLRRLRRPLLAQGPPAYALGSYRGTARTAVLAYKERGRRDLAEPFALRLAVGLHTAVESGHFPRPAWIVPAPSRPAASRRRGGPHMLRIARHLAAALRAAGWSVAVADCLALRSGTRDSVGLLPAERVLNLSGRLRIRPDRSPPPHASVVLLDDVITTGATAAGCALELGRAGVEVVAVLALTATG